MFGNKDDDLHYEEIRKIKKQHFERINDLENENHDLKNKLKTIEIEYEQQILALKGQLKLERDKMEVEKQTKIFEAEKEIASKKEVFSDQSYRKMEDLLEKEKNTLRSILGMVLPGLTGNKEFKGNLLAEKTDESKK